MQSVFTGGFETFGPRFDQQNDTIWQIFVYKITALCKVSCISLLPC